MMTMIVSNDRYSTTDSRRRDSINPFVQLIHSQIDQQAAEDEFRHVAKQRRRDGQHQRGDRGNRQAGQPPGAAAAEVEQGAAD